MTAQVLDGVATAKAIKAELAQRVSVLAAGGVTPGLGTVLVGEDPGSRSYVAGKHRDCAAVGIASIREDLPADATQADVEAAVRRLNADPACTGYIVQLPLPKQVDTNAVLELIDPAKDADGLHPTNLGRLVLRVNEPVTSPLPCTPRGIIELGQRHGVDFAGKHVVVVGRGVTVGRSIGLLLTRREINATVTLTHTGTRNLAEIVRGADIVVAAAGVPGIIQADMVAPGAVVFDVGVSRVGETAEGKAILRGDVAPEVAEVAGWLSPNPGGVGPMTRAMLLANVVETAERAARPVTVRIATINVNGIRAAIRRGMPAWFAARTPDVLLLQEIRAPEEVLAALVAEHLGADWHVAHVAAAAKGRAGVAVVSRYPIARVRDHLPLTDGAEPEGDVGRWLEADLDLPGPNTLTVVSTYLYSGTAGTPSMADKYAHLDRVTARLGELAAAGDFVLGGDINIAHTEQDLRNWKGNRKNAGFLPDERAYLDRWYDGDLGLVDVGRRLAGQVEGPYTWWSWRGKAFDNDSGWRIDVQITTPQLASRVSAASVDRAASYDARFSDHAPFVVDYAL